MKRIFIVASVAILAACNSPEPAKTDDVKPAADSTAAVQDITSPYPIGYSSKFVMGDPKNAENLLTLWKDWDNGSLATHKEIFADSVELTFADGTSMHASRDSIIAGAQTYRNTMAKVVSSVDAIMAVNSTDKNENWALIWGKEVDTDKKGKVDSFNLQETWRFNKSGQADLMYQFKQGFPPAKK